MEKGRNCAVSKLKCTLVPGAFVAARRHSAGLGLATQGARCRRGAPFLSAERSHLGQLRRPQVIGELDRLVPVSLQVEELRPRADSG